MKKTVILVAGLMSSLFCSGQVVYSDQFGRVNTSELTMTEYSLDKDAEALVIFDQGEYFFTLEDYGNIRFFQLNMHVRTKIKILSTAGLDYANFEIPFYSGSVDPEVVDVSGQTYNIRNEKIVSTPLGKNNIFVEKINGEYSLQKVAFPDVQVGSVIEFECKIKTRHYFNMRTWRFQKKIPVRTSSLRYMAMPFWEYTYILKGASKFDTFDSEEGGQSSFQKIHYKPMYYTFGMKNLQAFRDEEFVPNTDDYMINLYFQMCKYYNFNSRQEVALMSTWPKLCQEYLKDAQFGKYMDGAEKEGKKIIASLGLDDKTELEKLKIISDHVKDMYSWDGNNTYHAPKKLNAFLNDKTGTSGNINLFMIGLLKAAGLKAEPVVLSTRAHGRIYRSYPFTRFLDFVLGMVVIGDEVYYVDGTIPQTKFNEVSPQCGNVEGLIVAKTGEEWVEISQNEVSSEFNEMVITPVPDKGILSVDLKQTFIGNQALRNRRKYNGNIERMKEPYLKTTGIMLKDAAVENYSDRDKPFICLYKYDVSGGDATPGKIVLNPLKYVAPSYNMFTQKRRRHPVDLGYALSNVYNVSVEVPAGYEVEYLPESVLKDNPKFFYMYNVKQEGNTIIIKASYSMTNYYQIIEYGSLKTLYGEMVEKFSDAIIFSKISE